MCPRCQESEAEEGLHHIECAYCHQMVVCRNVPAQWDDTEWGVRRIDHAYGCEWANTKGFRVGPGKTGISYCE